MDILALLAAFGLVLLNGFFVATEFAIVKVRPTRIDELIRENRPAARAVRVNAVVAASLSTSSGFTTSDGNFWTPTPLTATASGFSVQLPAESVTSVVVNPG